MSESMWKCRFSIVSCILRKVCICPYPNIAKSCDDNDDGDDCDDDEEVWNVCCVCIQAYVV